MPLGMVKVTIIANAPQQRQIQGTEVGEEPGAIKRTRSCRSSVPLLVVRPVEPRKRIRGSYLFAGYPYASIDNGRFLSCDNYRYRILRQRKGFIEYFTEVKFEDMV